MDLGGFDEVKILPVVYAVDSTLAVLRQLRKLRGGKLLQLMRAADNG